MKPPTGQQHLRRLAIAAIALVALAWSTPAVAGPFTILKGVAKAGQAAKGIGGAAKAAKLAKAAKAAGVVKAAPAAKAALLAGGATFAAERAGLLFASVPDDAARVATYVAGESGGTFRTVLRSGEQATYAADDLAAGLRSAGGPDRPVDVYLDLNAARATELPRPKPGERWFVMDASGKPHPVRVEPRPEGLEHVVDVGASVVDLQDFAAMALGELDEEQPEESGPPAWFIALGVGALGLVAVVVVRRRRRAAA